MSSFICALSASSGTPTALALVELTSNEPPHYAVRALRSVDPQDPMRDLSDLLASEPQFVAQTAVVTTGGQAVADGIHASGPSAVAVTLHEGPQGDSDALGTTTQTLVDTFERLYRAGVVEVDASLDLASAAVNALYSAADLEAAASEADLDPGDQTGTLGEATFSGQGPAPTVIEQSGNEASVSTEAIDAPISPAEASAAASEASTSTSRAASGSSQSPDLGEHADLATALALACWYGEARRDALPTTDQADVVNANRLRRTGRSN